VYAETCPHYLTLTEESLLSRGPQAKIGPRLRTAQDNQGLWRGIQDGTIDTIASDHAPKIKQVTDDFVQAAFGSPSVETVLTITYDAGVNTGRISVPRLVQLLSETPAKIFGYYPRKGSVAPGSDADLVIFDPMDRFTIEQSNQHSQSNYTLYEGRQCLGRPVWVMQRGSVLIENGRLVGKAGRAQYLPTRVATRGLGSHGRPC
jgi:dihydropyrimidinase